MRTFVTFITGIFFLIGIVLLWFRGFYIISSINYSDWTSADFLVIALASTSLFGTLRNI